MIKFSYVIGCLDLNCAFECMVLGPRPTLVCGWICDLEALYQSNNHMHVKTIDMKAGNSNKKMMVILCVDWYTLAC